MQRKVIVFGGGGQLGFELCKEFNERGWSVLRFDRQALDITNSSAVEKVIGESDPRVVINSAAYNQVDIAESEPVAAYQVNALAVRNFAVACRQAGARLVHFSTDYVFDGKKGSPYTEADTPRPLGAYGVSKLAGELYAQAYLDDALIIRTSGVFGPAGTATRRGNFPEMMLRLAKAGTPIRVVEDHIASPTYAPAMASRTADLVERRISGLFHMGGGEPISWYAYAKLIFDLSNTPAVLQPTDEREYRTAARRPKFSALSNEKLEKLGIAPMPSLREAVTQYLEARQQPSAYQPA
ncbi:MAG: dTDP-4-dehydrorhamnose reductase [Bryobacteraceae bacterium]